MTEDTAVLLDGWPTPATIIGELLDSRPEAASLRAEASHSRALAASSTARSGEEFQAAQAARLACEELRHRLDPRRGRPVHFDVGLLLLAALGAGLAMLSLLELSGLLNPPGTALVALAVAAVWLAIAWLAAAAGGRRRWALLVTIIGAALLLGSSLAALHGPVAPYQGWPAVGDWSGSAAFGAVISAFIIVLVAGAAALIARMEPASLLVARRRWHRARAGHERAVRVRQADLEAAAVAAEAWLGLVRTWVTTKAGGEERLIGETMALAAALVESAWPKLPPVE